MTDQQRAERIAVAKIVWDAFSARMGGSFEQADGTMAKEHCLGVADRVLAALTRPQPQAATGEFCECGRSIAHRTEWGCEQCGWPIGKPPNDEPQVAPGQVTGEMVRSLKYGDRVLVSAVVEQIAEVPSNWPVKIVLDRGESESIDCQGNVHFSAISRAPAQAPATVIPDDLTDTDFGRGRVAGMREMAAQAPAVPEELQQLNSIAFDPSETGRSSKAWGLFAGKSARWVRSLLADAAKNQEGGE